MSSTKHPMLLEQVATALAIPICDLARDSQRKALGLARIAPPIWCTDGRVVFFCPVSVQAAVAKILDARDRLRSARLGVLDDEWTGLTVRDRDTSLASERVRPQPKNIQK